MHLSLIIVGFLSICGAVYGFTQKGKAQRSPVIRWVQRTPLGHTADQYEHWNLAGALFMLLLGVALVCMGVVTLLSD
jgi:hypothetical protein